MNNDLVLVASASTPGMYIFEALSGKQRPTPVITFTSYMGAFNFDSSLAAFVNSGSPYLNVVDTSDGTTETLTGGNPAGSAWCCQFSPDGSLLAVGHSNSPFVTVYDTSDWSKVTLSGGNPTSNGYGVSFNHDGSLLAVAGAGNPGLTVYDTSDWSKVTITGGAVAGQCNWCEFSPDGAYLAVATSTSPTLVVYDTSDWSKETISGTSLFSGYCLAWNPAGTHVALMHSSSPFMTVFDASDWSKETLGGGGVANAGNFCSFSSDGTLLFVHTSSSPFSFYVYETSGWTVVDNPFEDYMRHIYNHKSLVMGAKTPRFIRGTVYDENGDEADRTVNVYRRSDSKLVGTTVSDAVDGTYEVELVDGDIEYDVQFQAGSGDALNDLFFARVESGDT